MLVAKINPAAFRENVFANGMHVSAEAGWTFYAARLDATPDTAESFLAHIFNCGGVNAASTQSNSQAFSEVRNKVSFGGRIVGPEAAQVFVVERIEVHWRSFEPVYFSLCR